MKLNPDCIRDILFDVEATTTFSDVYNYDANDPTPTLAQYSGEEVLYHVRQAHLSGLLTNAETFYDGSCTVFDLSPEGHNFLNDIRLDTNWNKTKNIAIKTGSFSLNALTTIATGVITNLANSYLDPNP